MAGWLKKNLFATPRDTVLTIIVALILLWLVPPMLNWLFFDAVWTGDGREACLGEHVGACWAFVEAKFGQFMYGRYPVELRWRVDLTGILLIAGLVPIAIPSVPYKRENALYLLVIFPVVAFMLLTGWPFLEPVETTRWGGLLVTLVVAIVGIVVSFPLGILLDRYGPRRIISTAWAIRNAWPCERSRGWRYWTDRPKSATLAARDHSIQ